MSDQPNTPTANDPETTPEVDLCLHCQQARTQHSGDREACVKALAVGGYYGNRFATSRNATITVTYGDNPPVTITLDGLELAESSNGALYLSNASRGFIADEVEKALIALSEQLTQSTVCGPSAPTDAALRACSRAALLLAV